jgi:hypothetical protein
MLVLKNTELENNTALRKNVTKRMTESKKESTRENKRNQVEKFMKNADVT